MSRPTVGSRCLRLASAIGAIGATLIVMGCGDKTKKPTETAAATAEPAAAAKTAEAAAQPTAKPAAAPTSAATAQPAAAAEGASVMDGPCPLPGEAEAACPHKPAQVDALVKVAHILIGWDGSTPGPKPGRDEAAALSLARQLAHDARKPGSDFIAAMWKNSQDPGPGVYDITPQTRTRMVAPFTNMAESLGVGQVDIVRSRFGFHVMKRVPSDFALPEKPLDQVMTDACPAAGEDPAACPKTAEPKPARTKVSHILIGFKGSLPGRPIERTKEEARKLAVDVAHQARKQGADFDALMKAHSQDPGPGTYEVTPAAGLVPPFKQLGLSLSVGNVDIVETQFGFHVMKRVE